MCHIKQHKKENNTKIQLFDIQLFVPLFLLYLFNYRDNIFLAQFFASI